MQQKEGFLSTDDGLRLHYQILGNGKNTIISPAASWLAADFEPLTQEHTIIFYDQRSRGQSDAVTNMELLGIQHEVRDVETVRQFFSIETFSLIGWSYLGGVAALYSMNHPERIERLLLIGSASPRDYTYEDPRNLDANTRLDPTGLQRLEEMQQSGFALNNPLEYSREYWKVYLPRQMGNPASLSQMKSVPWNFQNERPEHIFSLLPYIINSLEGRDWRSQAAAFQQPTLIVHGLDDLIPLASSREWTESFPNARLLTIAGAGHYPWIEAPDTFFSAVKQFMNGNWPLTAEDVHIVK